ncbi:uncharacterized protein LOC142588919 [Dermacentor variabilis]|uniref:uncharacterized protein LOC142588919 n=1 Tax=Dermacentor variabilis TaxID=34621 RepID=UPI003F5BB7D1
MLFWESQSKVSDTDQSEDMLKVCRFCNPVSNCGAKAYPACPCTTLRSALQKITSATSITCYRSDYYCFYIPSLVAAVLEDWLSHRPAPLLVLHSRFRLRWVSSTLLHIDSTACAPKRLLRPRASPATGATTTAFTLGRQWRPAGRLNLSPRPALLLVLHFRCQLRSASLPSVPLHYSTVSATKDYFGHERHLLQERPLLLLHWVASGVLLVDWTCLHALHYYLCGAPVFDCGGYPAHRLSVLHSEFTSGTSISHSMSDCYCFYVLSRTGLAGRLDLAWRPCT